MNASLPLSLSPVPDLRLRLPAEGGPGAPHGLAAPAGRLRQRAGGQLQVRPVRGRLRVGTPGKEDESEGLGSQAVIGLL